MVCIVVGATLAETSLTNSRASVRVIEPIFLLPGASMDAYNLPGNWTSTANALEHQAHMLDGVLFVVDDYSPDITKADAQRRAATADRLMRGAANRAGRGRLRPDGTQRPDKPPRAQILVSAEDLPPDIPSLLARAFIAEVVPGCVRLPELTKAQGQAAEGQYALAMSGYVTHLARRYDSGPGLPATLADVRRQLRDKARAEGQHPRVALNVASLALGRLEFLPYAVQAGAINERRRDELWRRAWKALRDVGGEQERYRRDADPVSVYLRSLATLVASGRAHLAAATMDGGMPKDPAVLCMRPRAASSATPASTASANSRSARPVPQPSKARNTAARSPSPPHAPSAPAQHDPLRTRRAPLVLLEVPLGLLLKRRQARILPLMLIKPFPHQLNARNDPGLVPLLYVDQEPVHLRRNDQPRRPVHAETPDPLPVLHLRPPVRTALQQPGELLIVLIHDLVHGA